MRKQLNDFIKEQEESHNRFMKFAEERCKNTKTNFSETDEKEVLTDSNAGREDA